MRWGNSNIWSGVKADVVNVYVTCTEELTSIRSPSALNKLRESIMKQPKRVRVHLQWVVSVLYLVSKSLGISALFPASLLCSTLVSVFLWVDTFFGTSLKIIKACRECVRQCQIPSSSSSLGFQIRGKKRHLALLFITLKSSWDFSKYQMI